MINKLNNRGQTTIFIIIAIILVASVIVFFAVREKIPVIGGMPQDFQPAYSYFLDCIEGLAERGADIAGVQGGYIYPPEFEPGSDYAPFSSQFDFMGFPVPYWYYLSQNGFIKEQVPKKSEIEKQLEQFIENKIKDGKCNLAQFANQDIAVELGEPKVNVDISDNQIKTNVKMNFAISKGELSARKTNHEVIINSKLGKFYDRAVKIYNHEKQTAFLENYGIDVMRLYAPVTGTELSCSPLIWNPQEVSDDLKQALSANIQALKVKGNYYNLNQENDRYFVLEDLDLDLAQGEAVDFLYSEQWPSKIEIWPVENEMMVAEPVGLQAGLGALGFCYVPYHFVYDIYYPVLVQIYDKEEMFQFPVAVIIDKSVPREALEGASAVVQTKDETCNYKNTLVNVYTYDNELQPVEADITFRCSDTECNMGKTEIVGNDAKLSTEFPQCINAYITARAEGYRDSNYIISTNQPATADILMNKLYKLDVKLQVDGLSSQDMALITFAGENYQTTIVYPEQEKIELSEDDYEVSVSIYSDSSLKIPESTTHKCIDVPRGGLFGLFGATKEKCIDITIPEQEIPSSLVGGGKSQEYILDSQLKSAAEIVIDAPSLPTPSSLEELGQNYEIFETQKINVYLR